MIPHDPPQTAAIGGNLPRGSECEQGAQRANLFIFALLDSFIGRCCRFSAFKWQPLIKRCRIRFLFALSTYEEGIVLRRQGPRNWRCIFAIMKFPCHVV